MSRSRASSLSRPTPASKARAACSSSSPDSRFRPRRVVQIRCQMWVIASSACRLRYERLCRGSSSS
ncbi:hypothetical protein WN73_13105 [Bradyrhizobium sp. CCBAU 45394]|nr:hypothetical protein [Bradyrhizobium sp. CCBAU 45394]